jgi:hypothetical protein
LKKPPLTECDESQPVSSIAEEQKCLVFANALLAKVLAMVSSVVL